MKTAVLFTNSEGLGFFDVRTSLLRIPEVRERISQAQSAWDQSEKVQLDLFQYFYSDDEDFKRDKEYQSLCSGLVQIGLFDRLKKNYKKLDYLVGEIQQDSVLKVVTGEQALESWVNATQAASRVRELRRFVVRDTYEVYEKQIASTTGAYRLADLPNVSLKDTIIQLSERNGVLSFISVGPGVVSFHPSEMPVGDLHFMESIDLDPLLGWFWRTVKEASVASA